MEENVENIEVSNTTIELIDYTEKLNNISENINILNDSISFVIFILILWFIFQNFIFKKGWIR